MKNERVRPNWTKMAFFLIPVLVFASRAEPLPVSLKNTALETLNGTQEIVFCTRPLCQCHLMYATFGEYADEWDKEVYPKVGSAVKKLDLKTGKVTTLFADPNGNIRDVRVSYDGGKVLFAWRHVPPEARTHEARVACVYHLFEMCSDGSGIRQITDGPDDDFDGCYLPDGGILFGSGRCRRFIPCNRVRTSNLYRCDADGKNVLPLSSNVLLEDGPAVLPDGRIVYTRWDYVDRATETFRDLWLMNPDGTGQQLLWGGSDEGRAYQRFHAKCDAMPVPGTRQVVCTFSPAFGYRENAGHLYLVDLDRGPDDDAAAHRIGPDVAIELGWSIGNGGPLCMKGFRDPYPLSGDCFLVARGCDLQLVNRQGTCETVWTDTMMVHDPQPLMARPREPVLAEKINRSMETGVFMLADVYQSRNMKDVPRGTVKKLLIMEDLPKSASRHGPRGAHGGHISLHRIIGEVPVEADGSASFEVPAMRAFMFAALDEKGIAVKRMQNFTQVMPGEVQGCVGCHEKRTENSGREVLKRQGALLAATRAPSKPLKPEGVPDVFVYRRDIQPILDRRCVSCHSTEKATARVILSADLSEWRSLSYDMLYAFDQISRATSWKENGNHGSYGFGTGASPLMRKLDGSHHGVKVTTQEWDAVRLWIESSAHYSGTYATHNHFESQVGAQRNKQLVENGNVGGDWWFTSFDKARLAEPLEAVAQRKCYSCHENMYKLGRLRREQRDCNRWTNGCPPDWLNSPNYSYTLFNMTQPEKSPFLAAAMPRDQGGYGWCTNAQGKAAQAFTGKDDPDYAAVLKLIAEADARQRELGRLEYPGYRPKPYYVYWMKRFGILPPETDLAAGPIDYFKADADYWQSLWWKPE